MVKNVKAAAVLLILLLTLCGCDQTAEQTPKERSAPKAGKTQTVSAETEPPPPAQVFRTDYISRDGAYMITPKLSNAVKLFSVGGKLAVAERGYVPATDELSGFVYNIMYLDEGRAVGATEVIRLPKPYNINDLSPDGGGWLITSGIGSASKQLLYYENGAVTVLLDDLASLTGDNTSQSFLTPFRASDGTIYFSCQSRLYAVSDGKIVLNADTGSRPVLVFETENGVYVRDVNGLYHCPDTAKNKCELSPYPDTPAVIGDKVNVLEISGLSAKSLKVMHNDYDLLYGPGYDIYYVTSDGIYGYDYIGLETPGEPVPLLDFADSSLTRDITTVLKVLSPTLFFGGIADLFSTGKTGDMTLALLEKVPDAAVSPKTCLTLGTLSGVQFMTRAASVFNITNPDYRVDVVDYSAGGTLDRDAALRALELDIVSGKAPDLLLTSGLAVDNYAQKGIVKELTALGVDSSGLLSPFRPDGVLYEYPVTFSVTALFAAGEPDFTKCPQLDGGRMFRHIMSAGGAAGFVDYETGECTFDSDKFIALLEFAKSYPAPSGATANATMLNISNSQRALLENGAASCLCATLYSASDFAKLEFYFGGGEYAMHTFPYAGYAVNAGISVAVTSGCSDDNGAVQFLGYLGAEELVYAGAWGDTLLCNREALEASYEKYFYGDNDRVFCVNTLNETMFIYTKETAQKQVNCVDCTPDASRIDGFIAALESAGRKTADVGLLSIILDEFTPFYGGQNDAAKTARKIQSRAKIYLSERYG